MSRPRHIAVIGAGIVGVSTGIWLRRAGIEVTIVDKGAPGQGTSYGNAGVLASCSVVPVTGPGLLAKAPGMLLNPEKPLFLRWSYLPKLAPWLWKYLSHANDADTRRIAKGLTHVVGDSVLQHQALTKGTPAAKWVTESDYTFAYTDRAAFEADAYGWELRREAGFVPDLIEGAEVQAYDPALGPAVGCLAVMRDHGHIKDPGGYVAELAEVFRGMGGTLAQAEVRDVELVDGKITALATSTGRIECDGAVVATGVWSKPLMQKLGINVPLESERGYHIVFEGPEGGPRVPTMVAAGKFVATPMKAGLRCAGIVEFGGLEAGPSAAPFALLRREVRKAFPGLTAKAEVEWMGHRPATSDSLPLVGEVGATGVYAAFGHHHIGLTGGPKTGRMVADLIAGNTPNIDMSTFSPRRYAQ